MDEVAETRPHNKNIGKRRRAPSSPPPSPAEESSRWLQRQSKSNRPPATKKGRADNSTCSAATATFTTHVDSQRSPTPAAREPLDVSLSPEQCRLLDLVLNQHKSVFFTGSAGTGKSTVLKQLINMLPAATTFVTASTGVAAVNIGGITLHQFAGVGLGEGTKVELAYKVLEARGSADRWQRAKVLIIDEVSMVDADLFDKLDYVARVVRGKDSPFGGIQLVCCGDFFQLPPVARRQVARPEATEAGGSGGNGEGSGAVRFCFEAQSWKEAIHVSVELTQVHRQRDTHFATMLNELRRGIVSPDSERMLVACTRNDFFAVETSPASTSDAGSVPAPRGGSSPVPPPLPGAEAWVEPTRLYSTNKNVDELNHQRLSALPGKGKRYRASDTGRAPWTDALQHCSAAAELKLKVGAQVMLLKNLDVSRGLSNGARGVVVGWDAARDGYPVVRFASGVSLTVLPAKWTTESPLGTPVASRRQVPLKLAWALSIHKCQGATLDRAQISLARVFEYGQAYVALSRVSSLAGLHLLHYSASAIRAHPKVLAFDSSCARLLLPRDPTASPTAEPPGGGGGIHRRDNEEEEEEEEQGRPSLIDLTTPAAAAE